jgi:predicted aspartyl protease
VISGTVNSDWEPVIILTIAGQDWEAVVDTGFNDDLELPHALFGPLTPQYEGEVETTLAAGQVVVETIFSITISFDGLATQARASFAATDRILLGTHLLCNHRLTIDFPARTVLLERVP